MNIKQRTLAGSIAIIKSLKSTFLRRKKTQTTALANTSKSCLEFLELK